MMHRQLRRASLAASLLLPALSGCVFHKAIPPPVVAVAPPPEPMPAPLYSTELSQNVPSFPDLPSAPPPSAQPAPPPKSEIETARKQHPARHIRGRRGETELAERDTHEKETRDKDASTANSGNTAPDNGSATADGKLPVEKVTAPTPSGDTTQPTPIGQLTAGPTQDADASKNQASDLIQNTQRGINSLHRSLSSDQEKTVTQIRSFLLQAQRAMHNGDIDGAYTLATKAKVLLDELNGST